MTNRYVVVANKQNHLVIEPATGRCLGGLAISHFRPWVYPLYTPAGITVVQEAPPDHPFHNGFFVGQSPVETAGRTANFWATPPPRMADDPLQVAVGRMSVESPLEVTHSPAGVQIEFTAVWRDEKDEPVLDELRTIRMHVADGVTLCDMSSRKTARYSAVTFPATKHGSIGIRVEPRLLPGLGGTILADSGRRATADDVHEKPSRFVAYENELAEHGTFGVFMTPLAESALGTWFVRDYGMAMYDATCTSDVHIAEGESWTVGLRVGAYDGLLDDQRADTWINA